MNNHKSSIMRVVALSLSVGLAVMPVTVRGDVGDIFVTNNTYTYGAGTIAEYTLSGTAVQSVLVSGLYSPPAIALSGSDLFVVNWNTGTIGEYTTAGTAVNRTLVSGLSSPGGIALLGSNMFVTNYTTNTIGEYTTAGATVNRTLISGLNEPFGIAVSGSDLFVVNYGANTIGEYTTTGATVNTALVSGLSGPRGIAVLGSDLFVTNETTGTIGEYTTTGAVVNARLVSGLNDPEGIVVSGSNLFVVNYSTGTIGEYTTSGGTLNTSLVSGLSRPYDMALMVPATVALTGSNATIITGGTGTLGSSVTNAASTVANNLNYTLGATVQSGSATLGAIASGTGSLAPNTSQSCTVPATSTNLGVNTISITASDPNASNSPQTTIATLTVLDHSNASFSSSATQTTQTISFGNVLRGATIPSQTFTIYNRAANTTAAYTANLKLTTGFTTIGDPALTTNLAPFNGLQAAAGGNTFTASLNTSNYSATGINSITMSASQLADDSTLPGAGNNNNGDITLTLQANVGKATADAGNSPTSFGTALTAPAGQNASYTNLESMATATTGSGGYVLVGSTATILAGSNSSGGSQTISMAWRTQTLAEQTSPMLISDVVQVSGMSVDIGSQTSPFVLQMTYNPSLLPGGAGNEGPWASNEWIYLGSLDNGTWVNAVSGNFGSSNDDFVGFGAWSGDTTLGDWGVNTANHTVWAVVNYNGDFAVVPEPSTLALLAAGVSGFLNYAWRRRTARRTVKRTTFEQPHEDGPAILSFQSLSFREAKAAQRAA